MSSTPGIIWLYTCLTSSFGRTESATSRAFPWKDSLDWANLLKYYYFTVKIKKIKLPVKSWRNPLPTFCLVFSFTAVEISSPLFPRAATNLQPCCQQPDALPVCTRQASRAAEPANTGALLCKPIYKLLYKFHSNTALLPSQLRDLAERAGDVLPTSALQLTQRAFSDPMRKADSTVPYS